MVFNLIATNWGEVSLPTCDGHDGFVTLLLTEHLVFEFDESQVKLLVSLFAARFRTNFPVTSNCFLKVTKNLSGSSLASNTEQALPKSDRRLQSLRTLHDNVMLQFSLAWHYLV